MCCVVLCFFQMAVPFSKDVSTGQTMSHWLFPSTLSSRTHLWTSVWTCAQRGWVGVQWVCLCIVCLQWVIAAIFQEKSLAVLAGDRCYCGFPTSVFSLHDPEDEEMCLHRCQGEEFESCGNDKFFVVYQTQVQGKQQECQATEGLAACCAMAGYRDHTTNIQTAAQFLCFSLK